MKKQRLVSSLDIPQVKDMYTFGNFNSSWIHFPYNDNDYTHIDKAHHFRIWLNTDRDGYYPIGKKYKLGKCLEKIDEATSYQNAGTEYHSTLRQAFKAGVEWCKQDPQFLINDKQNQAKIEETA